MMGDANPQRAFFYHISLETFVPDDHPLRRIRPLIDDRAIRRACRDLYSPIGRPGDRASLQHRSPDHHHDHFLVYMLLRLYMGATH